MKDGKCVKCGSATVFTTNDGIVCEGTTGWSVRWSFNGGTTGEDLEATTYACTTCGYFENYGDPSALAAAADKWTKVEAR